MFQFKKQVKETKEQVLQTEEKLNLHPLIHVSDSLLDYHKKLSLTEVNSLDELQEIQNTFQTVLGKQTAERRSLVLFIRRLRQLVRHPDSLPV